MQCQRGLDTVPGPRYNEARDWQKLFAKTRFRYIEVLFHILYYYWGNENRSLYRRLRAVPHFLSGIAERARRERACVAFLACDDCHARSRLARSTVSEAK